MFKKLFIFFENRRLFLAILIVAISAVIFFPVSKINFTEDISDMIPLDLELERYNFASSNININEKIILNIYLKDSIAQNPDLLVAYADSLEREINIELAKQIKELKITVDNSTQEKVYEIFHRNLPFYLTPDDYLKIDSMLSDDEIKKTLEADYKNLISPAGLITKKFIKNDPLSLTPIALLRLQKLQTDDNYQIYDNHILTKNRKNLLMFISSDFNSFDTEKSKIFVDKLNRIVENQKLKYNEIETDIFGAPVISSGNANRIKNDIILTVSIALLVLMLFLSFFYKKFYVFFVIFLPAAFGAAVSIALIYFIQGTVSAVSLGIGSVLVGISIDYSLHIFTHARSKNNVKEIFADISLPIIISSITTSSAFFSLYFVSSAALNDLGLFAGISVLVSAIFALIVMPHFVSKNKNQKSLESKNENIIEKFVSFNFHKSKYFVIALLVLTVGSLFFVGKVNFESDLDKMNYMDPDLKKAEQNLHKISNIAYRTMYLASAGETTEDALRESERIENVIENLYDQGVVKSYSSVFPVLVSDSLQNIRARNWKTFWTQEKKDSLKAKLILHGNEYGFKENAFEKFYEYLDKDFEKQTLDDKNALKEIFLSELLNENKNLSVAVTLLKLKREDKQKVYDALLPFSNVYIVDKEFFTTKVVNILKKDFDLLVKISLSIVFLILLMYFGRIELSLITFIPMFLSWIFTLGVMGLFGLKFTIFNIIISTFIFGLGIDYSIFVMQGLLQEYRYGAKNLNSYKTSVFLSAITTIVGIGVLIFAQHPALRSIAFLSVIGIISVVIFTYTLLPLMFYFLIKQQGKMRSRPVTAVDLFFSILVFLVFVIFSVLTIFFYALVSILPLKKAKRKLIFRYWLMYVSKMIVYVPLNVRKKIINRHKENFKKPAVIISNHQAHIDIPLILLLYPKIIILTNDWVQNNIFYGKIVKFAEFMPISDGYENLVTKLAEKVKQGYSILVYPEGTRSKDLSINRFHKGAFFIADKLNLDILPIILQGSGHCVPKGEPFLKSGRISINILKRENIHNFGEDYKTQAKNFRKYYIDKYAEISEEFQNVDYYKSLLIANYIYKTPVLENYLRVKIRLEDNYRIFDKLLPKNGIITDIGCGYGFLDYMLNFVSPQRKFFAYDYDCQKIETAKNNISKNENLNFECADVTKINFHTSNTFIINDVLHYMTKPDQKVLIEKCLSTLIPGGKLIIRDGNSEMKNKHKGTQITEIFSTKILAFNKTQVKKLHFTSKSEIQNIVEKRGFKLSVIDQTVLTSNQIFVIEK